MNTAVCCMPRTIPLSRPWPLRWAQAAADGLRFAAAAWRESRRARAQAWDLSSLGALGDHLLRDIGAPDWVRAEAAARCEAELHCARLNSSHLFDRGL